MARRQTKLEAVRQVVLERIHRDGLLSPGAAVLVACSGGADSTALLHILMGLADQAGWRLGVVHVDHGQHRDAASIARLVRSRCHRHGIPFHGHALDPLEFPPGASEAELRQARYRVFRQVADRERYDRIATGHTASDQAETVLMRLLRGTGPGGLAGIPAEREGLFIRPMLDLDREQIRDYLRSGRLRWQTDPTNSDPRLLRNRLRLEVMPLLRRTVNPAVDGALVRLSTAAARDERALDSLAAQVDLEPLAEGGVQARLAQVRALEAAVQIRVFRHMVAAVAGPGLRLEQRHLERWLEQLTRGSRFRLGLQAGLEVVGRSGWLRLAWTRTAEGFHIQVPGPGVVTLPGPTGRLEFRLDRPYRPELASADRVFFDAAGAPFPLCLRTPRSGDCLCPWAGRGKRKVARLLSDAKIPASLRPWVALLVSGSDVLWLAGVRRSQRAPVNLETRSVLSVVCLDGPRWGP